MNLRYDVMHIQQIQLLIQCYSKKRFIEQLKMTLDIKLGLK